MTHKICEWDPIDKVQRERDSTPEEDAQREIDIAAANTPSITDYTRAIQDMLDAKAQERNYDGILSACTYATSTVAKFRAEGQTCVDWRDQVWSTSYGLMAQVEAGQMPQPTIDELLAMLPLMVWP